MILLGKADTAYRATEDAKALRILQRVLAQTSSKHPSTAIPVVRQGKPTHPSEEPPPDGTLPLLAPALHSALGASSSSTPSIVLPTPSEPPLFLLYNNIALVHLRTRKLHLARVYVTRALEAAQKLTTTIAPAQNGFAANKSSSSSASFLSAPSTANSRSLASSPASGGRTLLQPSSPHGSATSPRSPSHSLSSSATTETAPHLVKFLLTKQRESFANAGLVMLQAHMAATAAEEDAEDTEHGLQLAARCFRHALHLHTTPDIESGSTVLSLHVRLAECVIALHEHERTRQQSSSHSLLHSQLSFTPSADLDEAVLHLRAALVELHQRAASSESAHQLQLTCQIKLAHALSESQRHQEVITTLTSLIPSLASTSNPSTDASVPTSALAASPQLHLHAEFYAASSLIALARDKEALQLLARSTVPAVIEARKLAETSTAAVAFGMYSEYGLRFLALMVYIALVQGRDADARRMLDRGLKMSPRDAVFLQQLLALESRQTEQHQRQVEPIWLIKSGQQRAAAIMG